MAAVLEARPAPAGTLVDIGRLSGADLGRVITFGTAFHTTGVLKHIEHHTDEAGAWTTVVVETENGPRRGSYVPTAPVTLRGASE